MPDVRRQLLQRFTDTTQECRLLSLPAGWVQHTRQLRLVLETALRSHGHIFFSSLTQQPYTYPLRIFVVIACYYCGSRYSAVGMETRLRARRSGFESWQGLGIFLFLKVSRPALGST